MRRVVSLALRAVIGVNLAIAGLLAFSPNAAMAIPFPAPVFDCNVGCPGCIATTTLGCPGAGKCGTDCQCVGAGGNTFTCQGF